MAGEKTFENKIKRYLTERGAWFIKYWAGAAFTKSGVPDILACVNGFFIAIEVKAENGRPTDLQLHNVRAIKDAGGFAFILYPSAFEEFKKFINGLCRGEYDRDAIPEIWR